MTATDEETTSSGTAHAPSNWLIQEAALPAWRRLSQALIAATPPCTDSPDAYTADNLDIPDAGAAPAVSPPPITVEGGGTAGRVSGPGTREGRG